MLPSRQSERLDTHSTPRHSSTSSAIDLTGTPAGIGSMSSGPSSPIDRTNQLSPAGGSFSRRRLSWSRPSREQVNSDPLRLDLGNPSAAENMQITQNSGFIPEDPFAANDSDTPHDDITFTFANASRNPYFAPPSGSTASQASLIHSIRAKSFASDSVDTDIDDDEARLTSFASQPGTTSGDHSFGGASAAQSHDAERSSDKKYNKRKSLRYSTTPSPASRLRSMSRNLRRMSLRVVNLAGVSLEDHGRAERLKDSDDDIGNHGDAKSVEAEDDDDGEGDEYPDLGKRLPTRGRTLGFLLSNSRIRLFCSNILTNTWTQPIILLLIIFNAVVLTIQAARSLTLPDSSDSDPDPTPASIRGYFHQWEDYALFILFILFTLEAFARIVTSGFVLDPEVPVSTFFKSFLKTTIPTTTAAAVSHAHGGSLHRNTSQTAAEKSKLNDRLKQLRSNLAEPFILAHKQDSAPLNTTFGASDVTLTGPGSASARSDGPQEKLIQDKYRVHHIRDPSKSTFFATAFRGDGGNNNGREFLSLPFRLSIETAQDQVVRNVPYLRHSWNRIDFLAIVSFWIMFLLATFGVERGFGRHIAVFRALSVLRTARLLAATSGTTTIMGSLKRARPLLTNVAYFVLFAMIIFSVIGVQSFQGSFRRSCWVNATLGESDIQLPNQRCGGFIDQNLDTVGFIAADGSIGTVKGYICPLGQTCREQSNPHTNITSFDTVYFAALQVIIVASANGWAPIMYDMIDSEFFISCFFFIVCIIVLNFWLINLFVAVITNTFSAIRSDTKKSAFGAAPLGPVLTDEDGNWDSLHGDPSYNHGAIRLWYEKTKWIWVLFALSSVVLQATRSAESSDTHLQLLMYGEIALTFLFDVDIIWRFLGFLPRWRAFFDHGNNWLDLILAIGCSIIQLPVIRNSPAYSWLTIFQLARFYRVILEVPRMRPLLLSVFGNLYGLVNMLFFLLVANFVAALFAVQLLRGDLSAGGAMNFGQVYNSFLAMYQVLSSENWTDVLYDAAEAEVPLGQSALVTLFISGWFLFANFILVQLFIAVINENFDVAEELKKGKQATHYLALQQPTQASPTWLRRLNPYRWFRANPKSIAVENLPSSLVLPMQKSVMESSNYSHSDAASEKLGRKSSILRGHYSTKSIKLLHSLFTGESNSDEMPLVTLRSARRGSAAPLNPADEDLDRHLEILAAVNPETSEVQDITDILFERRAQKADFIRAHPTYDKTFWIFSQKNPIRKACQKLVRPANGDRIFGTPHSPVAHTIFQLLLLVTVISGIVVEIIATPIYRRNYYIQHGRIRGTWFDIAEATFSLTLFIEFSIKLTADGFAFTPNAYIRSIWNVLDLLILTGLIINVNTSLIFIGGLSRFSRSLKALRALRLITLIEKMRSTIQSLIFAGAIRILDAALLAILYMIPYAVWGLNIFAGLLNQCNDGSVTGLNECSNEYVNNPIGDGNSFGFLVPRVWNNPAPSTVFSFDSFRASLLILFEIVSLEGWIDVMTVATSATGKNLQPQTNASQANAIFFLIYNLLGAIVILTLFVSIIIGNFSSKTGVALLTKPQREWIDLQKLIKRQGPSKRPKQRPTWPFRAWCYDRAVNKHGWWTRTMTILFLVHVFALMTQTFEAPSWAQTLRNVFFAFVTIAYVVDIAIRWYGLGFVSFKANGWNIFDVLVASGALITTVLLRIQPDSFLVAQLQKLFLVSIAFKLVQRTNSLNQLFKTAIASLPVILSLLALWFIFFLFFAILFVEVFSLTKWDSAETRTQNYTTVGSALVMLAFMSTGEGWNQYMHDYALLYPRCTEPTFTDPDSDCGSTGWAFTLFIAWNLLSMYIFVNMFTGVVVESFSYVFQLVGGTKSITREEMRAFKKVWAEFADQQTGYLDMKNLVPFLGKLSGIFEVRIYPNEYRTPGLLAMAKYDDEMYDRSTSGYNHGLDLRKLARAVQSIDGSSIRKRRAIYNRLYHEALVSQERGKGISFTNMLLMLAHYKLIDDREALVFKDLVTRTEVNRIVTDLVNLDRVRSLLRTIVYRRQFLATMAEKRQLQKFELHDIPAIVVENSPTTPPTSTRDITMASRYSPSQFGEIPSPMPSPIHSPDLSWASETLPSRNRHALRRQRKRSDISNLSADLGYQHSELSIYPRDSHEVEEDAQHVLSSMQNSLWGEVFSEAAQDEERFTQSVFK